MTRRHIVRAVVLLTVAFHPPLRLDAQARPDERAAVLAVAESALGAVSRSDFVAFTDLMLDSAVTFSAGERNGQFRLQFSTRAQQRATPTGGKYAERGFRPEVHLSGPLAMVWLPYDFYRDGKWSQCGVDAFTLLKADGRWRIATLVWSVEQPPACQRHPSGPPPGASPN
jgi:ketosteroid isomerase-like protein